MSQFGDQLSKQQARITKNEMRKLMHFRRLSLEISREPHAVESEETVKSIQVRRFIISWRFLLLSCE